MGPRVERNDRTAARVALDVLHFESIDATKTNPRGSMGKDSFGASLDDDIKVTARLSRPAYAYLIVFRPDGKDEVLYPEDATRFPERTDEPCYPSKENRPAGARCTA